MNGNGRPSRRTSANSRLGGAVLAALLAASTIGSVPTTASAAPEQDRNGTRVASNVMVKRGQHARTTAFVAPRTGEAVLTLTSRAPGASWQTEGSESGVVSVHVDNRYVTDIVIPSDQATARSFTIGHLTKGVHTLRLQFASDRSPSGVDSARLSNISVRVHDENSEEGLVLRHSPVMYGRNVADLGSRFQSATTDTPLIAYHEVLPATAPGHRILQYTIVWSNEDGGTDSPALMARWGRTTDIEWAYRVEVDARGDAVPGTGVYQAANHQTLVFAGTREGDRPLLETCTSNNNMCDEVDDPMRFSPSTLEALPAGAAREHQMDVNPWTYPVMAQEMLREGQIESPSDPATVQVGDQRTYLYVAVAHTATPAAETSAVGLAVGVRLKGDDTLYTSDHDVPTSSVNRDGTAATTVELPAGTRQSDISEIVALRRPIQETGATLTVTGISRAFLLKDDYYPDASFVDVSGSRTLTQEAPTAVLWSANG
ncbi:hypothetical protein [Streptomyces sp. TS71-3]|uniref:hypothetical protein n=1 Tax=Streptomyces sp. TS71-3 TaxID=2733862 RepID=UPI001B12C5FE|nr:hypothetical protein [Streptomyces sp. TS71-3]GHJ37057.1 hypothetical protein Sm713_26660 [Streptomyces sp. TS71-3]